MKLADVIIIIDEQIIDYDTILEKGYEEITNEKKDALREVKRRIMNKACELKR